MPAGTSASSNDCSFSSSSSPETSMHRFSLGCQVHFPFWRFKRRQRPETNGIYPDRHLIEFRSGHGNWFFSQFPGREFIKIDLPHLDGKHLIYIKSSRQKNNCTKSIACYPHNKYPHTGRSDEKNLS